MDHLSASKSLIHLLKKLFWIRHPISNASTKSSYRDDLCWVWLLCYWVRYISTGSCDVLDRKWQLSAFEIGTLHTKWAYWRLTWNRKAVSTSTKFKEHSNHAVPQHRHETLVGKVDQLVRMLKSFQRDLHAMLPQVLLAGHDKSTFFPISRMLRIGYVRRVPLLSSRARPRFQR